MGQIYPSLSVKGISNDGTDTNVTKPETNCSNGARKEIDRLFDEDSQGLANSLRKTVRGRRRIIGTSTSPRSRELLMDSHIDDFQGEVFDSGDEPFDKQWGDIYDDYNLNRKVDEEVPEIVDTDDNPEEEVEDGKAGNKVVHKSVDVRLEPSPVIRGKRGAIKDTEVGLQQQLSTEDVDHKVLSQNETEQTESVLDSKVLSYDEYTEDAVQDES